MATRRIESPRYGMVVSDGIAGRVFMLLRRTHPDDGVVRGDDRLVWEALRINTEPRPRKPTAVRARVFLAPGEFAEVVPDDGKYEFVGGSLDGERHAASGASPIIVALPLPISYYAGIDDPEPMKTETYELRRDGRYHVAGGM